MSKESDQDSTPKKQVSLSDITFFGGCAAVVFLIVVTIATDLTVATRTDTESDLETTNRICSKHGAFIPPVKSEHKNGGVAFTARCSDGTTQTAFVKRFDYEDYKTGVKKVCAKHGGIKRLDTESPSWPVRRRTAVEARCADGSYQSYSARRVVKGNYRPFRTYFMQYLTLGNWY